MATSKTESTKPLNLIESASAGISSSNTISISYPGQNDCLLGRGGESNNHRGNVVFRGIIESWKRIYRIAPRSQKQQIVKNIVAHWRAQDPPGRFLAKDPDTGGKENPFYYEVGDEAAKKRTAKSLSERIKGVYTIRSSMGASPIPPSPATVLSEELTTFLPPPTPEPQQEDDLLSYYLGKAPEKASKRTHAAPPGELERKQSKFLEGVVEESISRLGHTWKGSLQGLQTERSATEAVSDDDSLPTAADLLQGEMFP